MTVKIIGKTGSRARRAITKETGILLFKRRSTADIVVNYGLASQGMAAALKRNPALKHVLMLNKNAGMSKYKAIKLALDNEILAPESALTITNKKGWLQKPFRSIGGKDIKHAETTGKRSRFYYQKFIDKRRFELRVHAFSWINPKDWHVQKRLGDKDTVAWNYKNGGTFQTIKNVQGYKVFKDAIDVSDKILKILGVEFGAIDFVVDTDYNVYFIEANAAPGFEELSKTIYVNAFKELAKLPVKKQVALIKNKA